MGNLCVKHEVADHIELVEECRLILTEIMEDFHNFIVLHNLFKPILERVE